jgi:hypothetical protein
VATDANGQRLVPWSGLSFDPLSARVSLEDDERIEVQTAQVMQVVRPAEVDRRFEFMQCRL